MSPRRNVTPSTDDRRRSSPVTNRCRQRSRWASDPPAARLDSRDRTRVDHAARRLQVDAANSSTNGRPRSPAKRAYCSGSRMMHRSSGRRARLNLDIKIMPMMDAWATRWTKSSTRGAGNARTSMSNRCISCPASPASADVLADRRAAAFVEHGLQGHEFGTCWRRCVAAGAVRG